jgi:hypothetical protein
MGDAMIWQVEALTADAVLAVADRVAIATSFEDLIYRESEIDALWTLADIAVIDAGRRQDGDVAHWTRVRDQIALAHDLVPEGGCAEAAAVLRKLAELL